MELIASTQELCLPLLTPLSTHARVFYRGWGKKNCRIYTCIKRATPNEASEKQEERERDTRVLDVSGTAKVARVSACIPSLPLLFINLFTALVQK